MGTLERAQRWGKEAGSMGYSDLLWTLRTGWTPWTDDRSVMRFERCPWCLMSYRVGHVHCCICQQAFLHPPVLLDHWRLHQCQKLEQNALYTSGRVWVEYTWRTDETKVLEAQERAAERAERTARGEANEVSEEALAAEEAEMARWEATAERVTPREVPRPQD